VAKPRRQRRPRTTLVILVLVSLTLITLEARGQLGSATSGVKSVASDVMDPVRSTVDAVVRPIGSFFAGSVEYGAVQRQNEKLQEEIGALRQQVSERSDAVQRLSQLSELDHLPFVGSLQTVPAEVINEDASNFAATIQIDVGRANGVALGMPVVGYGGLVGQVVEDQRHTATVRLITDGQSVVGATYGKNAVALAVVDGNGSGRPLSGDLVPPGTVLHRGEVFTTSGLQGAIYPPGIPVAEVVSSRTAPSASQESVTLRPMADLSGMAYVSVLLWGPPS
jgi:rod shape-determining protein MreC